MDNMYSSPGRRRIQSDSSRQAANDVGAVKNYGDPAPPASLASRFNRAERIKSDTSYDRPSDAVGYTPRRPLGYFARRKAEILNGNGLLGQYKIPVKAGQDGTEPDAQRPSLSRSSSVDSSSLGEDSKDRKSPTSPRPRLGSIGRSMTTSSIETDARPVLARRISSAIKCMDLTECDPEMCVGLLKLPSIRTYAALSKKLRTCNKQWMSGFLEAYGLKVLLESVDTLSSRKVSQLTDAMMLLECVNCVKEVMNSKIGLEFIIDGKNEFIPRLVKGKSNCTLH